MKLSIAMLAVCLLSLNISWAKKKPKNQPVETSTQTQSEESLEELSEEDLKELNLIRRNPLINGLREMFKNAKKAPSIEDLSIGSRWNCRLFQGLEIDSPIFVGMAPTSHSFDTWGQVVEDTGPMGSQVQFYAVDKGELAGMNNSGELLMAIRITEQGDLIMEGSVGGVNYFKSFFGGLLGRFFGGKKDDTILAMFQKAMHPAIASNAGPALAANYTLCPGNKKD